MFLRAIICDSDRYRNFTSFFTLVSVVCQSVPGVCVGVWSEFTQTVYRYHHFVSWVDLDFLCPIVWSVSWPVCQSVPGPCELGRSGFSLSDCLVCFLASLPVSTWSLWLYCSVCLIWFTTTFVRWLHLDCQGLIVC